MNIVNTRGTLLALSTAATILGAATLYMYAFVSPDKMSEGITSFIMCLGFAGGFLTAHTVTKNSYVRTLMRLQGWNGGKHAVWVRVYDDGRIVPERNSSIIECSNEIPTIWWDPYKGKETSHVIVRGQVYKI